MSKYFLVVIEKIVLLFSDLKRHKQQQQDQQLDEKTSKKKKQTTTKTTTKKKKKPSIISKKSKDEISTSADVRFDLDTNNEDTFDLDSVYKGSPTDTDPSLVTIRDPNEDGEQDTNEEEMDVADEKRSMRWKRKKKKVRIQEEELEEVDKIVLKNNATAKEIYEYIQSVQVLIRKMNDEEHIRFVRASNHNVQYIRKLLEKVRLFETEEDVRKRMQYKQFKFEVSEGGVVTLDAIQLEDKKKRQTWKTYKIRDLIKRLFDLGFSKVYMYVPYMRYSKQFINTYAVAFMIIYFFTLFGMRLSNLFGKILVLAISSIYRFAFKGILPSLDWDKYDFMEQFRMACLTTSSLIWIQLALSIRQFHLDLKQLHTGQSRYHLNSQAAEKKRKNRSAKEIEAEKAKMSEQITSDSLHFSGYLIAHIVYGYIIFFCIFFVLFVIVKFLLITPNFTLNVMTKFLLPIVVMVAIKVFIFRFLTKGVFLRDDKQRITNPAPYYIASFFNFFLDCFLGLVACASRIWQTTFVSIFILPRLDKSLFNDSADVMINRLDRGHLAYINYLKMEHWYNNPVLNGFCQLLIESMFYSQIYRDKLNKISQISYSVQLVDEKENVDNLPVLDIAATAAKSTPPQQQQHQKNETVLKLVHTFSQNQQSYEKNSYLIKSSSALQTHMLTNNVYKASNPNFKFTSYLRLRNLFYLCLFLRKYPKFQQLRYHRIREELEKEKAQTEDTDVPRIFSYVIRNRFMNKVRNKMMDRGLIKRRDDEFDAKTPVPRQRSHSTSS